VLNLDKRRNILSDLYDMNQIHNSVKARSMPESIAMYSSNTVTQMSKDRYKNDMTFYKTL